ncbi:cationic amino acid transporter 2, vacuolar isoform X1 [Lolium perenne]|uniref:cationic amino acid transporter 2, vacuolar isoform X1 n=1 Tax=Lolium perenne TaxID=4522 RepID=UPI0021F5EB4D|nr:cationic amino acid transporter 2, vacuolar-like isoform X1 [Lolium perenne]XP_051191438.1 cationic amino acid transporter 2, vacuolar-like isoform X1 [Lolium perenne]
MQQGNRLSWSDLQSLARRKPAASSSDRDAAEAAADGGNGRGLAKALSVPHLTAIGVGSTIGAGIYVLVGTVAREHAGPALTVSFLIAGIAAALSALCYAELSCRFPSAGSAYHYSYICIGESVAWLIGWALILEYTIGGSTVARGISPNLALFFGGQDNLPFFLAQVHIKGLDTAVDPCAAILVLIVTALLCLGIKESSLVEGIITIANVAVMLFIICAGGWLGFQNGWPGYNVPKSYFPNGASGVFSGSATLFFAYIGFDAVASTAEEVKNPQRDLPLGMGLTLSLCCFLYMMVSVVIVGLVPYYAMDPDTPISSAFAQHGMQWAVYIISSGAVLALIASLIGAILPQPRIVMAMARDGLLPPIFSAVDHRTQVPTLSTILTGICSAILAFFMDVSQLAGMVSVGTLLAFTMVAISVLIVRYAPPDEMQMEGPDPGSLESLASQAGQSERDEDILGDPFGNVQEGPTASEVVNMVRRQKAKRCIILVCIGVIIFVSAVSFSSLPFYIQHTICAFSGLLLLGSTIALSCIGQDKNSLRKMEGFMCPFVPILPVCCILINVYLLMNLGSHTWIRVSVWLVAGALIYLFYGRSHSSLTTTTYQRVSPA